MKSIMPFNVDVCIECGGKGSQTHHCIFGPNRKNSEKYGLKVRLCYMCHHRLHNEAGNGLALKYQQLAQMCFEETHSHEEYMKIFGKNYIDREETV